MSTNNPRGFIEGRNLGGRVAPKTRLRRVKANGVSGSSQKFAGDPVVLVSGNTVARIPAAATAAALPILGVIRAVYEDGTYPQIRPKTHSLPTNGNFIPASTAGWVDVNEDPHQTYIVNTDATVVSTLVGQFVDVTANTPNTAAGRSGMTIEVATGTNTAAATVPFQVVGIAPNNLDGITGGENNQDVEVIIARGIWANTNKAR
jgi:hypothetical protein